MTSQPIPRSRADGELLLSARDERYTYIEFTESGRQELYDRTDDPGEQVDLCSASTDADPPATVLDRLSDAVADHLAALDSDGTGAGNTEASDEITARLKALGYQ